MYLAWWVCVPSMVGVGVPSMVGCIPSMVGVGVPGMVGVCVPSMVGVYVPSMVGVGVPSMVGVGVPSMVGCVPSMVGWYLAWWVCVPSMVGCVPSMVGVTCRCFLWVGRVLARMDVSRCPFGLFGGGGGGGPCTARALRARDRLSGTGYPQGADAGSPCLGGLLSRIAMGANGERACAPRAARAHPLGTYPRRYLPPPYPAKTQWGYLGT